MNDALYEHIVLRKSTAKDNLIRIAIIAALALLLVVGFGLFGATALIIVVVLAILVYNFVFSRLNIEYEYTLLNHEIDVDIIYSRQKRKRQLSFDLRQAEIIAPKGSPRLNSYKPEKIYDFTSKDPDKKAFAVMMSLDQKNVCILIEPNRGMIDHIRPWMGSKFHMD